jgi:hypothetical protein
MSSQVIKLIIVTDEDTAAQLAELAEATIKERESRADEFTYTDKYGVDHQLHYVLSETI